MDRNACILVWILSILGGDGVLLEGHGLPGVNATILEHHGGITKNEIHRPVDVTFTVELAIGVNI